MHHTKFHISDFCAFRHKDFFKVFFFVAFLYKTRVLHRMELYARNIPGKLHQLWQCFGGWWCENSPQTKHATWQTWVITKAHDAQVSSKCTCIVNIYYNCSKMLYQYIFITEKNCGTLLLAKETHIITACNIA